MANLAQNGNARLLVAGMLLLCGFQPALPGEPPPGLGIGLMVVTARDANVPPDGYNDTVDVSLDLVYDMRSGAAFYEIALFLNDSSGRTVDSTALNGKTNASKKSVSSTLYLSEDDLAGEYNVTCLLAGNDTLGVFSDEATFEVQLYPPGVYQPVLNAREYSLVAEPGKDAVYRLNITNQGNCADTVYLTVVSDKDWHTALDVNNFLLAPGETRPVLLCVTVPENVSMEAPDRETVTARSLKDASKTSTVELRTAPTPIRGNLTFVQEIVAASVPIGVWGSAVLRLASYARYDDVVNLSCSEPPPGCRASFNPTYVHIRPGETSEARLFFLVDENYTGPPSVRVTATARSRDGATNATASATFQIVCPDLQVLPENVVLSNYKPTAGETITIWANITNIGMEDASGVPVRFYNDSTVFCRSGGVFQVNKVARFMAYWVVACGVSKIRVVVDPDRTVPELNRSNNALEIVLDVGVPVLVVDPSDIRIAEYINLGIDVSPPFRLRLSVKVHNLGEGAIKDVRVGLRPDCVPKSVLIPFIPASGSVEQDFYWSPKSGEGRYNFTANLTGQARISGNGTTNVTLEVKYPAYLRPPLILSLYFGGLVGAVLVIAVAFYLLAPRRQRPQEPQGPDGNR